MERLLLLDGNGLIYRGYFALIDQPLTTSKGELVTAVFGFTNIVLRAIQDAKPDLVAVAFDLPKPTFRHDRYAEYKATRTRMPDDMREQIPKVREVVKALGIPVYEQEGFEADDAIATLVGQAEAAGFEVVILTGDLDMLQLVSERTHLMVSLRGGIANTVSYDLPKIEERWGLRPDQMLDYKALKGDSTDNIPGIPGVGEKTASKLVATWGSLDELYAHLDEVMPEKLRAPLTEYRDQVMESRELMRLVRDVDLQLDTSSGRVGDYDRETVVRLFREYEFRTLIDRLPPLTGERPEDAIAAMRELRDAGFPAAQGAGSRGGVAGAAARLAGTQSAGGQLQLSLDFDQIGRGSAARDRSARRPAASDADGDAAAEARAERVAVAAGDVPGALAAAIADPGRIEVVDTDGVAGLEAWLRDQEVVGTGLVLDDPRPLAGTPLALAVAGPDGRVVAAEGPDASIALRHLLERIDARLVGHEVKPLVTARFAESADADPTPVAFDTQIAAYLVNAALRAQKIADVVGERLDLVIPPAAAGLSPVAIAGLEALGVARGQAVARGGAPGRRRRPAVRRDRAAADPDPRPHGGRRDRPGPRRAADARGRVRGRDRAARARDLRCRRPRVHDRQPQAAGRDPVRRAGPAQGPQDEDRLLDGRERPGGAPRRAPGHRAGPRVADLHQAALDLRGGAADADRPRPAAPHAVQPGRRGDRPPVELRPEPPEHPDPDAARAADPPHVRRRVAGHDARRRGLQPDRAPDPRPRERRRAPPRRVRARGRHPPRDRGPGAPQATRGRHVGRAVDGQDGQLRARVRDERLRPVEPGRDQPPGGAGVHQLLLRGVRRDQPLHAPHPRDGGGAGIRVDAARAASGRSPSSARPTGRSRPPASGWRSTCRSRARPRTS